MGGSCAAAGGRNLNLTAQRRPQQRETHTEGQIKDRDRTKPRLTTEVARFNTVVVALTVAVVLTSAAAVAG